MSGYANSMNATHQPSESFISTAPGVYPDLDARMDRFRPQHCPHCLVYPSSSYHSGHLCDFCLKHLEDDTKQVFLLAASMVCAGSCGKLMHDEDFMTQKYMCRLCANGRECSLQEKVDRTVLALARSQRYKEHAGWCSPKTRNEAISHGQCEFLGCNKELKYEDLHVRAFKTYGPVYCHTCRERTAAFGPEASQRTRGTPSYPVRRGAVTLTQPTQAPSTHRGREAPTASVPEASQQAASYCDLLVHSPMSFRSRMTNRFAGQSSPSSENDRGRDFAGYSPLAYSPQATPVPELRRFDVTRHDRYAQSRRRSNETPIRFGSPGSSGLLRLRGSQTTRTNGQRERVYETELPREDDAVSTRSETMRRRAAFENHGYVPQVYVPPSIYAESEPTPEITRRAAVEQDRYVPQVYVPPSIFAESEPTPEASLTYDEYCRYLLTTDREDSGITWSAERYVGHESEGEPVRMSGPGRQITFMIDSETRFVPGPGRLATVHHVRPVNMRATTGSPRRRILITNP
ncbi:hypothetical protein G7046_g8369 [Stylonectria norvegica]|nr:hypothetical protein G7046_g8369 [Stylonectria norvegica]